MKNEIKDYANNVANQMIISLGDVSKVLDYTLGDLTRTLKDLKDSEKEEVIGSIINNQLSELKKIATEEKFRKVSKRVDDLTDYFSDFTHRVFTPNGVKSDDEDGDIISEGDTIADDLLFKVMGHNGRSIELPVDISYLKNYCLSTCISPKQLYNSLVWIALRLVAISFCIKELKVEKVSSKKSSK